MESLNLSPELMHELADFSAGKAVAAEARRRLNEGLSMQYDYNSLYHRAYEEAIHAYARAKTVETGGTEAP